MHVPRVSCHMGYHMGSYTGGLWAVTHQWSRGRSDQRSRARLHPAAVKEAVRTHASRSDGRVRASRNGVGIGERTMPHDIDHFLVNRFSGDLWCEVSNALEGASLQLCVSTSGDLALYHAERRARFARRAPEVRQTSLKAPCKPVPCNSSSK